MACKAYGNEDEDSWCLECEDCLPELKRRYRWNLARAHKSDYNDREALKYSDLIESIES